MELDTKGLKNFLNLNFNPDILTEEETKKILIEDGIDTNAMEEKFSKFVEKINARFKLDTAEIKRENFNSNLASLQEECRKENNEAGGKYRMAARNKNSNCANDLRSDIEDIKLLKKI